MGVLLYYFFSFLPFSCIFISRILRASLVSFWYFSRSACAIVPLFFFASSYLCQLSVCNEIKQHFMFRTILLDFKCAETKNKYFCFVSPRELSLLNKNLTFCHWRLSEFCLWFFFSCIENKLNFWWILSVSVS